jgi:hypothetical protein
MAASSPTTALATPNTPTRRSSWKNLNEGYVNALLDEKLPLFGASSNPFSPTYTSYNIPVPVSLLPTVQSDIEACDAATGQHHSSPRKRTRTRICVILLALVLLWAVFMFGAVRLFPGASKLRELREEMLDMENAVKLVHEQIGGLVGYVEGVREWVGEWEQGEGHEIGGLGHAEEVVMDVHGHGTVGGW